MLCIFAIPKQNGEFFKRNQSREHSSVGSERLPYKQRVGGSTPSAPTTKQKWGCIKISVLMQPL